MIISSVSARNWKTRTIYGIIYGVLMLGAITMVYPFMLMLAGSIKSEADAHLITPYPEFWFNDGILFQKYLEVKHNGNLETFRMVSGINTPNWRKIDLPETTIDATLLEDFREWRSTEEAYKIGLLGNVFGSGLFPANARKYRALMEKLSDKDIVKYMERTGLMVSGWAAVNPPSEIVGRYRNTALTPNAWKVYDQFKRGCPSRDLYFIDPLSHLVTSKATDKMEFIRNNMYLQYVRISKDAASAYHASLEKRHGVIRVYNNMHNTNYESFDEVPFVEMIDEDPGQRIEWEEFLKNSEACKDEWVEIYGPYEKFDAFRKIKGRTDPTPQLGEFVIAVDRADCFANKSYLRKEFTKRNYIHVLDYIARHGNGLINTLIYCALAIITSLLVNPLCAYALSRFKLPGTYQILLFCMATMAFPGEVSMIPAFILLKRFPLWPLLGAVFTMIVIYLICERVLPKSKEKFKLLISLIGGLLVGAIALPFALGPEKTTVSFLNTFAALILPGAANGYFIFLLKGFFDAMPKELYEAAELDGAGEWTKFWTLTMTLSKPILAVIALGAFTGAYSAFMMALIIIPDERMWTIMVWIYQLQNYAHGSVVYASIVLAAIPTFLIFAFCQNIIIRGIIVPTEK